MALPFQFISTHASVPFFFFGLVLFSVDHPHRMHIHHDHLDTALKKKEHGRNPRPHGPHEDKVARSCGMELDVPERFRWTQILKPNRWLRLAIPRLMLGETVSLKVPTSDHGTGTCSRLDVAVVWNLIFDWDSRPPPTFDDVLRSSFLWCMRLAVSS